MEDLDYCNIDVQRYRRHDNVSKKPKWRWLLLPLLPISIPIGFAIGLFRGIGMRNLMLDGDPDASEDLYNRCMRQIRKPTEEEMSIYRDLYEIGKKKVDQERMNDSTHREYVFDVFLLEPEGKRLILGDLLGRFYSVNSDKIPALALEMFHNTFPERRAVIVKYHNGDREPQSGDDLDDPAGEEVRNQFQRLNDESVLPMAVDETLGEYQFVGVDQLDHVDGDDDEEKP